MKMAASIKVIGITLISIFILSLLGTLYFYVPSYDEQRVEKIVQQVDETLNKKPQPGQFQKLKEDLSKDVEKDYTLSDVFYDSGPLRRGEIKLLDEIVLKKPELIRSFLNPKAGDEAKIKDIHPFDMLDYSKFLLAYADLLEMRGVYDQSWEILLLHSSVDKELRNRQGG
jgi:hypothetical protein